MWIPILSIPKQYIRSRRIIRTSFIVIYCYCQVWWYPPSKFWPFYSWVEKLPTIRQTVWTWPVFTRTTFLSPTSLLIKSRHWHIQLWMPCHKTIWSQHRPIPSFIINTDDYIQTSCFTTCYLMKFRICSRYSSDQWILVSWQLKFGGKNGKM